jgi:uncharacterized protein (DUF4415 family)
MNDEFDESILEDEAAFKKRFRRIERPAFLGEPKKRENKKPITIMLDPDIIEHFKSQAESSRTGYQTLINQTLRESILGSERADPLEKLLNNRKALKRLKAKLEAV